MEETIFQLLTALGSLGSMLGGAQAYSQLTHKEQEEIIKEVQSRENLGVIDEGLLKNITTRVKKAVKRLSDAYDNPSNTRQDIEREKEIARHEVCHSLRDIVELNVGTLSEEYLQKQWQSFRCDSL